MSRRYPPPPPHFYSPYAPTHSIRDSHLSLSHTPHGRISQKSITSGSLEYRHEGGDDTSDAFRFRALILLDGGNTNLVTVDTTRAGAGGGGDGEEDGGGDDAGISFEFTIIPVNDQPFRMITQYPMIKVIQGRFDLRSRWSWFQWRILFLNR